VNRKSVIAALAGWLVRMRFASVAAGCLLVQVLDAALALAVFHAAGSQLIDPGSLGRSALAALVGWGLASLGPNNSSKPTPLRGAA